MTIYTKFYKKLNSNSDYIKTERGSVFIDGTITISIFLGFIILGQIETIAPISDSIILLFISLILVYTQVKELKEEASKLIGERVYKSYETKYLEELNKMEQTKGIFIVEDVYIYKLGVQALVELTLTIDKSKSVNIYDITFFEKECKKLISSDGKFLEPKIYTYYID